MIMTKIREECGDQRRFAPSRAVGRKPWNPTLSEALAPVLGDLDSSGSVMPEVRDEQ
jgi:hypothetical protein